MASSIFFPYFYLSNDTLLRHQYLYASALLRVHPCDRPPRDNKQVKRFVSELTQVGFLENSAQIEFDEEIQQQFLQTLDRGFQAQRPLYLKHLGKYEKERASAKTFNLCRKKNWEELAARLVDMGIATVDNYDEWCFSTRTMTSIMTTYIVLDRQRSMQIPRCTDADENEDLAMLLECAPLDDGKDAKVRRAILEFPYIVPLNLNDMQLDRLMTLRDALQAISGDYLKAIQDDAVELIQSSSILELEERIKCVNERMQEINGKVHSDFSSRNEPLQTMYVQYRFYAPADAPLSGLALEGPIVQKEAAFTAADVPVSPSESERILSYPGSFVWGRETPHIPRKSGGLFKRLFSFGKS